MNLPKRAEDAHATLAAAFNTGDVATILSMYDVSGIFVPQPNRPVTGLETFEESIRAIVAIKGRMEIKTVSCLVTGDIALGRSEWRIIDEDKVQVSSAGIEVMKQQTDGTWKIVIDQAFDAKTVFVA